MAPAASGSEPAAPTPAFAPLPVGAGRDPAASLGAAASSSPEVALVVDGVNALRRDRDPRHAGALFDRYLVRYPDGILVEEVLVLAIQAASERGDPRAAAHLGERYLRRYPGGRFTDVARSAAQPSP
jgi:hypothetical protein